MSFAAGISGVADAATVSSNWAGWVALKPSGTEKRFSSVSGEWTEPTATCEGGRTYSAVWVGLGGYSGSELEQIGTDADCSSTDQASYTSWYELVPAAPVQLKLKIRQGDRLVASVTRSGHAVTLRIRNLTTGARFSATRHVSKIDASSAEWIAEAPSVCVTASACETLPLTDFGTVQFSSATVTSEAHTGTVLDPAWSALALELQQGPSAIGGALRTSVRTASALTAVPSNASSVDGSFSVTWEQRSLQNERPVSTLPGSTP
jgi:hypothetical protein